MRLKRKLLSCMLLAGTYVLSQEPSSIPDKVLALEKRVGVLEAEKAKIAELEKRISDQENASLWTSEDPEGHTLAVLGVNSDHKAGILKINSPLHTLVQLYGDDDGGNVEVFGHGGNRVILMTVNHGRGTIQVNGDAIADYAEIFELRSREGIIPGTVVSVDENTSLIPSQVAYDKTAVGVISGAGDLSPGMEIGTRIDGSSDLPVAIAGQVYVRVCLKNGPVNPGDLLVSSDMPGVAMRASRGVDTTGAVIGKAIGRLKGTQGKSEGLILMLVMNR